MNAARLGAITVALAWALALVPGIGGGQGRAQAQSAGGLGDPMQPPAFLRAAGPTAGQSAPAPARAAMVLQSTLMSRGRRIAMIDGKSLSVGDRIGAARIVAIGPASVTLREGQETRVLGLYQGVDISPATTAKTPATTRRTKEGSR